MSPESLNDLKAEIYGKHSAFSVASDMESDRIVYPLKKERGFLRVIHSPDNFAGFTRVLV